MKSFLSVFLVLGLLTGCSTALLKGQPAAKVYTLNAPVVSQGERRLPHSLQVMIPESAPGLGTERIALRKDDNQIDYYHGVRWASSLNALVQSLLVESFDNSNTLRAVGSDTVEISPDYTLLVEIRDFQMESNQSRYVAHVRMVAKLMSSATQKVVMSRSYDEKAEAAQHAMASIMQAFDKAFQIASRKMVADVNADLTRRK